MTDWMSRLFVLGADFSAPAGLPTANQLLDQVLTEIDTATGTTDNHLRSSLKEYYEYKESTEGSVTDPIDLEDFARYLDYIHFLGLRGSDTWSTEGNEDQLMLRWGIGRVLHQATPTEPPDLYIQFAENLRPGDVIFSFNYDLLVETALNKAGKPFRRFPRRFESVDIYGGTVDSEAEQPEITLLKAHGSIDWVSKYTFDRAIAMYEGNGDAYVLEHFRSRDPVFGTQPITRTASLQEGPQDADDPLNDVYTILDLGSYYSSVAVSLRRPPLILPPSGAKQLYGRPLAGFWSGMTVGEWWAGMNFIGYSLPPGDPYATQMIYHLAQGYQAAFRNPDYRWGDMAKVALVDLRVDEVGRQELLDRYRFLDPELTHLDLSGFDEDAINILFPDDLPYKGTT